MDDQDGGADRGYLRASDADRERVVRHLQTAFSEGRLTMVEFETRVESAYAARTFADLEPLAVDLPGGRPGEAPGTDLATTPGKQASRTGGAPGDLIGGTPGSTTSIAVMTGTERKGRWVIPPQHTSCAFWGGVVIDLRQARFAERHTTITAVAIMAGIDIIVPDDIHVEVNGIGLMGAFESSGNEAEEPLADGPVLNVNGLAFWGGVEIKRRPRRKRGTLPPGEGD
ncbi:DUF1707 SHOCT-like domain-containing protein [Haloechinothrix alba]|uniref:DUF1707 SHOCT-like domain-containing protein n=1 Tax=Haloechinothrix alba TaxID=664784 RepID=UPI000B7820B9|nr:DUF1707 domain-containing protein [Haloechinothrix alba]